MHGSFKLPLPWMGCMIALLLIPFLGSAQQVQLSSRTGYILTRDSVQLFYRVIGEGKDTITVIHGGPYNSGYLFSDLTPLAAHHVVIFYDQRGAGFSSVMTDPGKMTIGNYLADIDAVRDHFHLRKLKLMGHSTGGLIAGHYAVAHPERVGALILVNPVPASADWMAKFSFTDKLDSNSLALLKRNGGRYNSAPADSMKGCWDYYALVARQYYPTPVHARRMWGDVCYGLPANMLNPLRQAIYPSLGNWNIKPGLRRLKVPVLLVCGDQDVIPYASFEDWLSAVPEGRLVRVPGAGHFPHVDAPAIFFAETERFLFGGFGGAKLQSFDGAGVVLPADASGTSYQRARAAVIGIENELVKQVNASDWEGAASVYTEDGAIYPPGAPPVNGRKGIASFWRTAAARGMKSLELQLMDLEADGGRLIARGKYVMRGKAGEFVDIGKFMALYKGDKGGWHLQTDMFNSSLETRSPIEVPDYLETH